MVASQRYSTPPWIIEAEMTGYWHDRMVAQLEEESRFNSKQSKRAKRK